MGNNINIIVFTHLRFVSLTYAIFVFSLSFVISFLALGEHRTARVCRLRRMIGGLGSQPMIATRRRLVVVVPGEEGRSLGLP